MAKKVVGKVLLGGVLAAGAAVWAMAPRTFGNKRKNYVPTLPDVMYAHRGLHDAGSGLTQQYAGQSVQYVALARRMAMKAGFGSPAEVGPIAPENSLAAFGAAAEAGYGIALEVQLTLDNKVVVCHDPDLLRVAGDPRNIADLTYDELIRIPLFPTAAPGAEKSVLLPGATEQPSLVTTPNEPPKGYYQHVPLLSDVLQLVNGRVPIIVEFKFANFRSWDGRDEELMQQAADLLGAYPGPYAVASFSPAAMNWYKANHPEVCRGQLAVDPQESILEKPVDWGAGQLAFNWLSRPDFVAYSWQNGSKAQLRLARKMGAMAVAWVIRSDQEYSDSAESFDRFIFESYVPASAQ